jgi:hypothetical protein
MDGSDFIAPVEKMQEWVRANLAPNPQINGVAY